MGDIHIRNVRLDDGGSSSTHIDRQFLWMLWEIFLLGRWQEIDKTVSTVWTDPANVLLDKGIDSGTADLAVLSANSHQITSASGGFDAGLHEGKIISLYATDDSNRGMYNIRRVIDANTILVDVRTRGATWVDESSMSGRIHVGSSGAPFSSTEYFVMQAPAASGRNLQVHISHNSTTSLFVTGYPKGDWLTLKTATTTETIDIVYNGSIYRWNAFLADAAASEFYAHIYAYDNTDIWRRIIVGELTDVAVGDTDPGFVHTNVVWSSLDDNGEHQMINEFDVPIECFPAFYKRARALDEENKREQQLAARKINGGLAKVFRPIVLAEDTADGGFVRGNVPYEFCNYHYTDFDEFTSTRWKMGQHVVVPRNGADDITPLSSTAA